jgi:hypothetical protein
MSSVVNNNCCSSATAELDWADAGIAAPSPDPDMSSEEV